MLRNVYLNKNDKQIKQIQLENNFYFY